nr:MAG TPA: hypothetical protein [Caudoviricetes sp.]
MIQYHHRQVILYHIMEHLAKAGCYFCTYFLIKSNIKE